MNYLIQSNGVTTDVQRTKGGAVAVYMDAQCPKRLIELDGSGFSRVLVAKQHDFHPSGKPLNPMGSA